MKLDILSHYTFVVTDQSRGAQKKFSFRKFDAFKGYSKVVNYFYKKEGHKFYFKIGHLNWFVQTFGTELDPDSVKSAVQFLKSDFGERFKNWYESQDDYVLYDYQLDDIYNLDIRHGILSIFTNYGKTQMIAVISAFLMDTGKLPLIMTASDAVVKEIRDRLKSMGVPVHKGYGTSADKVNVVNCNGITSRSKYKGGGYDSYLSKVSCILVDEVERCTSKSAASIIKKCVNSVNRYGFSGTSDKSTGKIVDSMKKSSRESNRTLISLYGDSLVFKLPDKFDIKLYDVKVSNLSIPNEFFDTLADNSNVYDELLKSIFKQDSFVDILEALLDCGVFRAPIFCPLNRTKILGYWIKRLSKYYILSITGAGFIEYHDGVKKSLTIREAKDNMKDCKYHYVFGSSSSYRGLDFSNLSTALLIDGKSASVVLQVIGRTARAIAFDVLQIFPSPGVPMLNSSNYDRKKMIKRYYKNCNIEDIKYTL